MSRRRLGLQSGDEADEADNDDDDDNDMSDVDERDEDDEEDENDGDDDGDGEIYADGDQGDDGAEQDEAHGSRSGGGSDEDDGDDGDDDEDGDVFHDAGEGDDEDVDVDNSEADEDCGAREYEEDEDDQLDTPHQIRLRLRTPGGRGATHDEDEDADASSNESVQADDSIIVDSASSSPNRPTGRSLKFPSNTCSIALCPAPQDIRNKLVVCAQCGAAGHQKCLLFSDKLFAAVHSYPWQCIECKTCSGCGTPGDDEHLMLCDQCDRGYHIYCVDPPFDAVPDESWVCDGCKSGATDRDIASFFARNRSQFSRALARALSSGAQGSRISLRKSPILKVAMSKLGAATTGVQMDDKWDNIHNSALPTRKLSKNGRPLGRPPKWVKQAAPSAIKSPQKQDASGIDPNDTFELFARKRFKQDAPHAILPALEIDQDVCVPRQAELQLYRRAVEMSKDTSGGRRVRHVRIGKRDIPTLFAAPLPDEFRMSTIYMCEFCLKPLTGPLAHERHKNKCQWRHPPGDEIYRKDQISMFEVDGKKCQMYCQNLCMLAKMFLDHKTLLYDVEPFLFYVMTEYDYGTDSYHLIGYFSKEKRSLINNVCCIVVLPIFQRRGLGQWLIDFSYLLTKKEHRTGAPERPLSTLGQKAYELYWRRKVATYLLRAAHDTFTEDVDLNTVCITTGITASDVKETLDIMGFSLKRRVGNRTSDQTITVDLHKLQAIVAMLPSEDTQVLALDTLDRPCCHVAHDWCECLDFITAT